MHNIRLNNGSVARTVNNYGLTLYTQDLQNTIIDLEYLRDHNACINDDVILEIEPRLEYGMPLWDVVVENPRLLLNHRVWVLHIGIYEPIRENVIRQLIGEDTYFQPSTWATDCYVHLSDAHNYSEYPTYEQILTVQQEYIRETAEQIFDNLADIAEMGVIETIPGYVEKYESGEVIIWTDLYGHSDDN